MDYEQKQRAIVVAVVVVVIRRRRPFTSNNSSNKIGSSSSSSSSSSLALMMFLATVDALVGALLQVLLLCCASAVVTKTQAQQTSGKHQAVLVAFLARASLEQNRFASWIPYAGEFKACLQKFPNRLPKRGACHHRNRSMLTCRGRVMISSYGSVRGYQRSWQHAHPSGPVYNDLFCVAGVTTRGYHV